MNDLTTIFDTEESKFNFLKGLIYLAKADGNVDDQERNFFLNAAANLNINEKYINKLNSLFDTEEYAIELEFSNRVQGRLLLQEGIQLCYLDGKYDIEEQAIIAHMGELLQIDDDTIEKIENWVLEGIQWRERGYAMLRDGE